MMESFGDDRESGEASEKPSLVREEVESAKRAKTQGGETGSRSMTPRVLMVIKASDLLMAVVSLKDSRRSRNDTRI